MIYTTKAKILDHEELAPGTWRLRLKNPRISCEVRPGQFVMVSVGSGEEIPSPILKRALAVYQADDSSLSLIIRIEGDGTRKICQLAPGNSLNLVGPLGNGFDLERAAGKYSIITAGGSGIASVYLLARELRQREVKKPAWFTGGGQLRTWPGWWISKNWTSRFSRPPRMGVPASRDW